VLKERITNEPHVRWECRCSPYHQDSAFDPVIELVQRALAVGRDDSAAEKCHKIAAGLHRHGLADAEALSLWASLLSVPVPEDHPPLNLTPQRQKQKTLEAILEFLLAVATREPLLFIVEDLHWVDPSTLELLGLVVDQVATASVLMLLTGRPEFRPPWAPRAHVAQLMVNRFTRRQAEVQLEGHAGLAPLGVQVGAVGDGAMAGGRRRRPIHPGVQRLVAEGLHLDPREPGGAGAQHRGANGAAADPQALRHLPVGAPEAPLLSQDLPCLAHGQSLGGHPSPFRGADGPGRRSAPLGFGQRPDHDAPIPVITMPIFLITIDRSG